MDRAFKTFAVAMRFTVWLIIGVGMSGVMIHKIFWEGPPPTVGGYIGAFFLLCYPFFMFMMMYEWIFDLPLGDGGDGGGGGGSGS